MNKVEHRAINRQFLNNEDVLATPDVDPMPDNIE